MGAVALGTVVVSGIAIFGATSSDKTAPILAFAGAIIVALLTAYTTNRRQERALAAEHDRLQLQLRHDRTIADVVELRTVVDSALDAARNARVSLHFHQGP